MDLNTLTDNGFCNVFIGILSRKQVDQRQISKITKSLSLEVIKKIVFRDERLMTEKINRQSHSLLANSKPASNDPNDSDDDDDLCGHSPDDYIDLLNATDGRTNFNDEGSTNLSSSGELRWGGLDVPSEVVMLELFLDLKSALVSWFSDFLDGDGTVALLDVLSRLAEKTAKTDSEWRTQMHTLRCLRLLMTDESDLLEFLSIENSCRILATCFREECCAWEHAVDVQEMTLVMLIVLTRFSPSGYWQVYHALLDVSEERGNESIFSELANVISGDSNKTKLKIRASVLLNCLIALPREPLFRFELQNELFTAVSNFRETLERLEIELPKPIERKNCNNDEEISNGGDTCAVNPPTLASFGRISSTRTLYDETATTTVSARERKEQQRRATLALQLQALKTEVLNTQVLIGLVELRSHVGLACVEPPSYVEGNFLGSVEREMLDALERARGEGRRLDFILLSFGLGIVSAANDWSSRRGMNDAGDDDVELLMDIEERRRRDEKKKQVELYEMCVKRRHPGCVQGNLLEEEKRLRPFEPPSFRYQTPAANVIQNALKGGNFGPRKRTPSQSNLFDLVGKVETDIPSSLASSVQESRGNSTRELTSPLPSQPGRRRSVEMNTGFRVRRMSTRNLESEDESISRARRLAVELMAEQDSDVRKINEDDAGNLDTFVTAFRHQDETPRARASLESRRSRRRLSGSEISFDNKLLLESSLEQDGCTSSPKKLLPLTLSPGTMTSPLLSGVGDSSNISETSVVSPAIPGLMPLSLRANNTISSPFHPVLPPSPPPVPPKAPPVPPPPPGGKGHMSMKEATHLLFGKKKKTDLPSLGLNVVDMIKTSNCVVNSSSPVPVKTALMKIDTSVGKGTDWGPALLSDLDSANNENSGGNISSTPVMQSVWSTVTPRSVKIDKDTMLALFGKKKVVSKAKSLSSTPVAKVRIVDDKCGQMAEIFVRKFPQGSAIVISFLSSFSKDVLPDSDINAFVGTLEQILNVKYFPDHSTLHKLKNAVADGDADALASLTVADAFYHCIAEAIPQPVRRFSLYFLQLSFFEKLKYVEDHLKSVTSALNEAVKSKGFAKFLELACAYGQFFATGGEDVADDCDHATSTSGFMVFEKNMKTQIVTCSLERFKRLKGSGDSGDSGVKYATLLDYMIGQLLTQDDTDGRNRDTTTSLAEFQSDFKALLNMHLASDEKDQDNVEGSIRRFKQNLNQIIASVTVGNDNYLELLGESDPYILLTNEFIPRANTAIVSIESSISAAKQLTQSAVMYFNGSMDGDLTWDEVLLSLRDFVFDQYTPALKKIQKTLTLEDRKKRRIQSTQDRTEHALSVATDSEANENFVKPRLKPVRSPEIRIRRGSDSKVDMFTSLIGEASHTKIEPSQVDAVNPSRLLRRQLSKDGGVLSLRNVSARNLSIRGDDRGANTSELAVDLEQRFSKRERKSKMSVRSLMSAKLGGLQTEHKINFDDDSLGDNISDISEPSNLSNKVLGSLTKLGSRNLDSPSAKSEVSPVVDKSKAIEMSKRMLSILGSPPSSSGSI